MQDQPLGFQQILFKLSSIVPNALRWRWHSILDILHNVDLLSGSLVIKVVQEAIQSSSNKCAQAHLLTTKASHLRRLRVNGTRYWLEIEGGIALLVLRCSASLKTGSICFASATFGIMDRSRFPEGMTDETIQLRVIQYAKVMDE
jgi:hypothetical protein